MKNTANQTYICCCCGDELPLIQFYHSESDAFINTRHLPMCKTCVVNMYKKYKIQYMNASDAMKRLCMMFDIYYDDKLFRSCDPSDDSVVSVYIKKSNMGQYKTKTFDANVDEGVIGFFQNDSSRKAPEDEAGNEIIDPRLVEKWGDGLQYIDYLELDKHYRYLKSANPNGDNNQEIFIIDLCYIKMQQMKAVREGKVDDYNKLTESYRKSFAQAGLKTVRDAGINEGFILGVNAETIEKYTPAEYYKDKALYKDHDKIGEYVERFMLRPLRNLMHGTTDRDMEYYVKDEDEDDSDEYADDE